jgi:hypothetical protein
MIKAKLQHFHISETVFCCNCECFSTSRGSCCCCGSHSLLNGANILNRDTVDDYAREAVLWQLRAQDVARRRP